MTLPIFFRAEQSSTAANSFSPSAGKPALAVADWQKRFGDRIELHSFEPVSRQTLALAHDERYVNGVLDGDLENGFGNKSPNVAASLPYTVGSLLAACQHAVEHRTIAISPTSGFHHARYGGGGGFCTFNGLVVAARELKRQGLVKHVLIIDGDAHYGDGTTSCIAKTHSGGWLKQITADREYETAKEFFNCIDPDELAIRFSDSWQDTSSTLVIYQAGADAWSKDPLNAGVFSLEQLKRRDEQITQWARLNRIPLAINLAGGYATDLNGSIEPVLKIHRQTIQATLDALDSHP